MRYRIALGLTRWDARALDIMVDGARLEDQLERKFVVASPSFLRALARPWEHTMANGPGRSLFTVRALPFTGTSLFMRPEIQAHIDAHGGVTAQAGARRDGRLQICRRDATGGRAGSTTISWPSTSAFPSWRPCWISTPQDSLPLTQPDTASPPQS